MRRLRHSIVFWPLLVGLVLSIHLFASDRGVLIAQEPGSAIAADKRLHGRSYVFQDTGEKIPYAVFVPSNYDAARKWPLIVGLHGLGRPYDWLMSYEGLVDLAQRDGFIMVTPLGYRSCAFHAS